MTWNVVPLLFPGRTVFVVAPGWSLRDVAVDALRPYPTVVVNRAYEAAPWADALFFADTRFWRLYRREVLAFPGLKFVGQSRRKVEHPALINLNLTGKRGLEDDPRGYRSGNNSGYGAVNVAVHLGAARVVLVGFDHRRDPTTGDEHFHSDHEVTTARGEVKPLENHPRVYEDKMLPYWPTLVAPLTERGVEVLNATPGSAIDVFPRTPLSHVLERLLDEEAPLARDRGRSA